MRAFVAWISEDGEALNGPVEWHNYFTDALPAVGDTLSGDIRRV